MHPRILHLWGLSLDLDPHVVKELAGVYLPANSTASRSLSMQKYSWISPPGVPS